MRLCVVAALAILGLSSPALASPLMSSDQAMFRGDLAHTGVYAGSPIVGAPHLMWKFAGKGRFISSPTVAGGVLYIGDTGGELVAIDPLTGKALWTFKAHARIASTPAVADGVVFFGSYDGHFYALDARTGAVKWTFQNAERRFAGTHLHGALPAAETMPDPFDVYLSSPGVWDGKVYFGSGDGAVYALDAASGAVRWTFKTGDVVHASPAIVGGVVYIGSWDSWFYALDASTGREKWRFKTGEDPDIHNQVGIQSSAAVADGLVYFGCRDSNLYALDAETGKKVWAVNNKGSWVVASPAVRGGIVYAATSDSGKFYALNGRTGAEIFSLDFKTWPMFSSPAIVGDLAYIGSHTGRLYAIDLAAHKISWSFETDGARQNLAAYTNADGTPNYRLAAPENFYDVMVAGVDKLMGIGAVLSSPTVANGVVYFGSMDGNLYALDKG